jgi:hypothetical protein
MWTGTSLLPPLSHVSSVLAQVRPQRTNPGFDESELVGGIMTTDPIADFLTALRNALHARKERVDVPWSRLKEALAKVMTEEGFIKEQSVVEEQNRLSAAITCLAEV